MTGGGLRVIVFASRDAAEAPAARKLAQAVGARFIDRLTFDREELMLVVRYGVVEPVCIVVVDTKGAVRARIPRLLTAENLRRDVASLADHEGVR